MLRLTVSFTTHGTRRVLVVGLLIYLTLLLSAAAALGLVVGVAVGDPDALRAWLCPIPLLAIGLEMIPVLAANGSDRDGRTARH